MKKKKSIKKEEAKQFLDNITNKGNKLDLNKAGDPKNKEDCLIF